MEKTRGRDQIMFTEQETNIFSPQVLEMYIACAQDRTYANGMIGMPVREFVDELCLHDRGYKVYRDVKLRVDVEELVDVSDETQGHYEFSYDATDPRWYDNLVAQIATVVPLRTDYKMEYRGRQMTNQDALTILLDAKRDTAVVRIGTSADMLSERDSVARLNVSSSSSSPRTASSGKRALRISSKAAAAGTSSAPVSSDIATVNERAAPIRFNHTSPMPVFDDAHIASVYNRCVVDTARQFVVDVCGTPMANWGAIFSETGKNKYARIFHRDLCDTSKYTDGHGRTFVRMTPLRSDLRMFGGGMDEYAKMSPAPSPTNPRTNEGNGAIVGGKKKQMATDNYADVTHTPYEMKYRKAKRAVQYFKKKSEIVENAILKYTEAVDNGDDEATQLSLSNAVEEAIDEQTEARQRADDALDELAKARENRVYEGVDPYIVDDENVVSAELYTKTTPTTGGSSKNRRNLIKRKEKHLKKMQAWMDLPDTEENQARYKREFELSLRRGAVYQIIWDALNDADKAAEELKKAEMAVANKLEEAERKKSTAKAMEAAIDSAVNLVAKEKAAKAEQEAADAAAAAAAAAVIAEKRKQEAKAAADMAANLVAADRAKRAKENVAKGVDADAQRTNLSDDDDDDRSESSMSSTDISQCVVDFWNDAGLRRMHSGFSDISIKFADLMMNEAFRKYMAETSAVDMCNKKKMMQYVCEQMLMHVSQQYDDSASRTLATANNVAASGQLAFKKSNYGVQMMQYINSKRHALADNAFDSGVVGEFGKTYVSI